MVLKSLLVLFALLDFHIGYIRNSGRGRGMAGCLHILRRPS